MNYTTIMEKAKAILLWIYKKIANKFAIVFDKLLDRFPVIIKYPLLKYSLIPLFIAMLFAVRYILRFIINELATRISGFVAEISNYSISESTIVLSIAAVFIVSRIGIRLTNYQKEKANKSELNYESTK